MPGRNQQGDYRYAYQGQEKDPETGWEAFELRMYDGRVGRWMTTDPYSQYHSPYLAMGNNPVNKIDYNGGWVTSAIGALISGGVKAYTLYQSGELKFDNFENALKTTLKIGNAAVVGAVLGSTPMGIYGVVQSGLVGASGELVEQTIDYFADGKEYNTSKILISGITSAALNGAAQKITGPLLNKLNKVRITKSYSSKFVDYGIQARKRSWLFKKGNIENLSTVVGNSSIDFLKFTYDQKNSSDGLPQGTVEIEGYEMVFPDKIINVGDTSSINDYNPGVSGYGPEE
jgi:RHS repeat-associated protein